MHGTLGVLDMYEIATVAWMGQDKTSQGSSQGLAEPWYHYGPMHPVGEPHGKDQHEMELQLRGPAARGGVPFLATNSAVLLMMALTSGRRGMMTPISLVCVCTTCGIAGADDCTSPTATMAPVVLVILSALRTDATGSSWAYSKRQRG